VSVFVSESVAWLVSEIVFESDSSNEAEAETSMTLSMPPLPQTSEYICAQCVAHRVGEGPRGRYRAGESIGARTRHFRSAVKTGHWAVCLPEEVRKELWHSCGKKSRQELVRSLEAGGDQGACAQRLGFHQSPLPPANGGKGRAVSQADFCRHARHRSQTIPKLWYYCNFTAIGDDDEIEGSNARLTARSIQPPRSICRRRHFWPIPWAASARSSAKVSLWCVRHMLCPRSESFPGILSMK
jgi:hypothetical protein